MGIKREDINIKAFTDMFTSPEDKEKQDLRTEVEGLKKQVQDLSKKVNNSQKKK